MRPRGYTSAGDSGRMNVDGTLCMHCGACVGTCPANSIFLHETFLSFNEKCTQCGMCVRVCAVGAIDFPQGHKLSRQR
jgi:ferredoxin